jgi:hypothetical protein
MQFGGRTSVSAEILGPPFCLGFAVCDLGSPAWAYHDYVVSDWSPGAKMNHSWALMKAAEIPRFGFVSIRVRWWLKSIV